MSKNAGYFALGILSGLGQGAMDIAKTRIITEADDVKSQRADQLARWQTERHAEIEKMRSDGELDRLTKSLAVQKEIAAGNNATTIESANIQSAGKSDEIKAQGENAINVIKAQEAARQREADASTKRIQTLLNPDSVDESMADGTPRPGISKAENLPSGKDGSKKNPAVTKALLKKEGIDLPNPSIQTVKQKMYDKDGNPYETSVPVAVNEDGSIANDPTGILSSMLQTNQGQSSTVDPNAPLENYPMFGGVRLK
jgi:hypothetical protein